MNHIYVHQQGVKKTKFHDHLVLFFSCFSLVFGDVEIWMFHWHTFKVLKKFRRGKDEHGLE